MVPAAFFLWRGDFNTAFVVAALGVVAWFLSYRVQMTAVTRAADLVESNDGEREEVFYEEQ